MYRSSKSGKKHFVRRQSLITLNRYVYITHSTAQYLDVCADIAAPLGKVCSIVQANVNFYGTQFLSKSLTFVWCWLGTKRYHGDFSEAHHDMFEELAEYIDAGKIKCHLTQRLRLTAGGIKEAHRLIQSGKMIGKVALGISEDGEGQIFS
jgi:NADPH:quinone reductase-like Zn-dependent oxidoreductase